MAVILHTVMVASLGAYAVLLLFLRGPSGVTTGFEPSSPRVFPLLALFGIAQFGLASWVGRRILNSRRSAAEERVRRFFLIRGASAEAIGLYGLLAGLLRAPVAYVLALFVMAAIALAASAPTRSAWAEAMQTAQSPGH